MFNKSVFSVLTAALIVGIFSIESEAKTPLGTGTKSICIGGGVKVQSRNIVGCQDLTVIDPVKENNCVLVCTPAGSDILTFAEARQALPAGEAAEGACVLAP